MNEDYSLKTNEALDALHGRIQTSRGDIIGMFCDLVRSVNKEMQFDEFLKMHTGQDAMRLEVLRDMLLNRWIFVNENGCVEIDKMPKL